MALGAGTGHGEPPAAGGGVLRGAVTSPCARGPGDMRPWLWETQRLGSSQPPGTSREPRRRSQAPATSAPRRRLVAGFTQRPRSRLAQD